MEERGHKTLRFGLRRITQKGEARQDDAPARKRKNETSGPRLLHELLQAFTASTLRSLELVALTTLPLLGVADRYLGRIGKQVLKYSSFLLEAFLPLSFPFLSFHFFTTPPM